MNNVYKIIITEKEREQIVKAIEWYDVNSFDEENILQSIKIHLKSLPQIEAYKARLLCKQKRNNGTIVIITVPKNRA